MRKFLKGFGFTALFVALWTAADNVDKLPSPVITVLGLGALASIYALFVWAVIKFTRNF